MARMAMVSGLSSEGGRGWIETASVIGAPPLFPKGVRKNARLSTGHGRGGGGEGSSPRHPHPSGFARHLLPEGEGKERVKTVSLTQRRSGGLRGGAAASRRRARGGEQGVG